jgi:hypothetical protein
VLGELPAGAGKPGEKRPTLLRSALQSAVVVKKAESPPAKGTVGAKRAESRL